MGLTVKEKEHWKERIGVRINRAVDELYATKAPKLREETKAEAREQLKQRFGISDLYVHASELNQQIALLKEERLRVTNRMEAVLKTFGHSINTRYYEPLDGINHFLDSQSEPIERELLQKSEIGRRVLQLRQEEEQLLDTVWLATSPLQIRELWKNVAEMLGDKPTELQTKAFETPPMDSEAE